MGCFLACFGLKEKKKRRKPCKKTPSGQRDHGTYVPLHSHVSNENDIQENFTFSDSNQLREKAKEKIKKKVSFNLNVMAYEPIPHEDDDDEEGAKWEFNREENNVTASSSIYPTSHRYQNCRDSYDEEDNEFDFYEIEDNDDNDDDNDDEEFVDVYSSIEEDIINNQTEVKRLEPNSNIRDRRQYVLSVLNRPVENISQWKQVKAKAGAIDPPLKICEKENIYGGCK